MAKKEPFCFNESCEMNEVQVLHSCSHIFVRGEELSHREFKREAWASPDFQRMVMLCECCGDAVRLIKR